MEPIELEPIELECLEMEPLDFDIEFESEFTLQCECPITIFDLINDTQVIIIDNMEIKTI